MAFTGKIALRKRGENDRNRKRFKKNSIINPSSPLNNNFLFILSLVLPFAPPPVPPPLFSPVLPPSPSLIFLSLSFNLLVITPLILSFNPFYDTRP